MPGSIDNGVHADEAAVLTANESAELQMLIVMSRRASSDQVEEVLESLARVGGYGRVTPGKESTVIAAIGDP
jgi:hypothetical protein